MCSFNNWNVSLCFYATSGCRQTLFSLVKCWSCFGHFCFFLHCNLHQVKRETGLAGKILLTCRLTSVRFWFERWYFLKGIYIIAVFHSEACSKYRNLNVDNTSAIFAPELSPILTCVSKSWPACHQIDKSVVMGGPLKGHRSPILLEFILLGTMGFFHSMFSFLFADKEIFLPLNEYSPEGLSQWSVLCKSQVFVVSFMPIQPRNFCRRQRFFT